jgi:hypothetical protein
MDAPPAAAKSIDMTSKMPNSSQPRFECWWKENDFLICIPRLFHICFGREALEKQTKHTLKNYYMERGG